MDERNLIDESKHRRHATVLNKFHVDQFVQPTHRFIYILSRIFIFHFPLITSLYDVSRIRVEASFVQLNED